MGINNGNKGKENKENKENNEKLDSQQISSNKQDFIKAFVNKNNSLDDVDEIDFLDSTMKLRDINSDLRFKLENFLKDEKDKKKYAGVKIEDIKISDLKEELKNDYIKINSKRTALKKVYLSDFDLDTNKYNTKLLGEVNKLNDRKLGDLLTSDLERGQFLKSIFKTSTPERKETLKLFKSLKDYNLVKIFNAQDEEGKKILGLILQKTEEGIPFQSSDFIDMFEKGFFTEKQKIELVNTFKSSISLKEAIELNIVSDIEIFEIQEKILKKYLEETQENFDDIQKELFLSNINSEDILVDTKELFVNSKIANTIFSKYGNEITEEYNKTINRIHDSNNSDNDEYLNSSDEFEVFKKDLSSLGEKVKGIEKFKKGNIIEIVRITQIKDPENPSKTKPKEIKSYIEIVDIKNEDGSFSYIERGDVQYNSKFISPTEYKEIQKHTRFTNLMKFIEKGSVEERTGYKSSVSKINIFSKDTLLEKIKKQEIIEKAENPEETLAHKRINEIENALIGETNQTVIDELQKEKEGLGELNLYNLIAELDDQLNDPNGKEFGLKKGTTFITTDDGIYTIDNIDNVSRSIEIKSPYGNTSTINFDDFLREFKAQKCERKSNETSYESLTNVMFSDPDLGGSWNKFKFENNILQKKETDNNIEYDYLVAKMGKGEELIKIQSYDGGDMIDISFGTVDQTKIPKKSDRDQQKYNYKFGVENSVHRVSIGYLHTFIKNYGLEPKSIEENNDTTVEEYKEEKISGSFWSKIFKNYSISEVLAGGKLGIEGVQNYLKEGNEEHAAKFALGVFGKIMPGEIKNDLLTRVETAGKKRMDDYVQKLKDIDSGPASDMIFKWLINKDCPEHKKEAGLLFMIEKYGVIYAKSGLKAYRGQYLRYKALGGKVGDELFIQKKEEAEQDNVPFAEEELVYVLLVKQCKQGNPGGYKGIKRRSRLHKEFKRNRAVGKDDEYKTGQTDGADIRTLEGRIKFTMGELEGGTYPNAYGGLDTVIGKGGPMHLMNQVPFIMCFSGLAYEFEQKMLDQRKNLLQDGKMIPILRFMSFESDMDLLNETILELSKRIGETRGDGKEMYNAAKEIFVNRKSSSQTPQEKIEKTEKFYKIYGEVLTDALYMLNTGKRGDDSIFNSIILREKDDSIDEEGNVIPGNSIFQKYYNTFTKDYIQSEAKFNDEALMTDSFKGAGLSGMDMYTMSKQVFAFRQSSLVQQKIGPQVWLEIRKEFNAIANRTYDENPEKDKTIKKKLLAHNLRGLIGGILENHGSSEGLVLPTYNSTTGPFAKLNERGVYMTDFKNHNIDSVTLLAGQSDKGEELLSDYAEYIIENETVFIDHSRKELESDSIGDLIGNVKESTAHAQNN